MTTAQLSLAWVSSQGKDVVPIPGTTRIAHFQENLEASRLELSAEETARIAAAVPTDQIAGERYASGDKATFRGNL